MQICDHEPPNKPRIGHECRLEYLDQVWKCLKWPSCSSKSKPKALTINKWLKYDSSFLPRVPGSILRCQHGFLPKPSVYSKSIGYFKLHLYVNVAWCPVVDWCPIQGVFLLPRQYYHAGLQFNLVSKKRMFSIFYTLNINVLVRAIKYQTFTWMLCMRYSAAMGFFLTHLTSTTPVLDQSVINKFSWAHEWTSPLLCKH